MANLSIADCITFALGQGVLSAQQHSLLMSEHLELLKLRAEHAPEIKRYHEPNYQAARGRNLTLAQMIEREFPSRIDAERIAQSWVDDHGGILYVYRASHQTYAIDTLQSDLTVSIIK